MFEYSSIAECEKALNNMRKHGYKHYATERTDTYIHALVAYN